MDWRVLLVLLPVLLAAGWAVRNILPLALKQFDGVFDPLTKK
ncbi:photosystem II protein Y [Candidatus Synechococcus calcipolaris G9]|uniref:Photosystem II reaction center protein Y n=1 Tax=Candidatus Synechococcus calcipolaris G9 TaxID=1497997 RepID=A0ABT6EWP4_9SYNE|nr:photosystem II protein Y [Candidatus Synechococcus calcipolaris]MDG2990194.1 photosystem II protein Y [Candidatus Synechococcus calcipolaris G9]